MQVRLIAGPAGSGKTFHCLNEISCELRASAEGAPLLLIAPKQMTYQLERQILANPAISGYTRLQILSFDRLAHFIFDQLQQPEPEMLDEEGRVMVLRGLLSEKRHALRLFRASARLTGFAQELSLALRELQRHQLTPESLMKLAAKMGDSKALSYKLQDLAALLQDYLDWLGKHRLLDGDCLLEAATNAIVQSPRSKVQSPTSEVQSLHIAGLWVDGFVDLAPQELELLAALMPHCEKAALTFCLDRTPREQVSWVSNWALLRNNYEQARKRLARVPGIEIREELLSRDSGVGRFGDNPVFRHLEQFWAEPKELPSAECREPGGEDFPLRVVTCAGPEAEAVVAAREILGHVRRGGRFREVMVLTRKLDLYHQVLQRVFAKYEVPFFLDRRESVAHHPLAELTRSALRTVARQWQREDWFAALKTGLVPAEDVEIDRLENEALARGWKGADLQRPPMINNEPDLSQWLAELHSRIVPPFQRLALAMGENNRSTGPKLAAALRDLWNDLNVEQRLAEWADADAHELRSNQKHQSIIDEQQPSPLAPRPSSVALHATVWEQMNKWLENVELAFRTESLSLREWVPILDTGLAGLTVGVIPPALDQVLVGSIERSRTPEVKLAIVLGMNETIFPALTQNTVLLTETDRAELERHEIILSANARQQISRERYYAYLACTRARERLVLTASIQDGNGKPLNLSPFISVLRRLFPNLTVESASGSIEWQQAEHVTELVPRMLRGGDGREGLRVQGLGLEVPEELLGVRSIASLLQHLRDLDPQQEEGGLAPDLAARLYGPVLRTSVSRIEQFAACPFRFFIHSGLRAEERKAFELDIKEQGTFQHDVLAMFHQQLSKEGKLWRDISPQQARDRIARIAEALQRTYREGLFQMSEESRFAARVLTESLQNFVETLVAWMREQYQFDPVAVELPFGEVSIPEGDREEQTAANLRSASPAWEIELGNRHKLALHGRIDRIDVWREHSTGNALCVVVDYKSSHKQLDPLLMAHGLQLQLLAYLNVVRQWPDPIGLFGVERVSPAGVFYVNLRGRYQRGVNRSDALIDPGDAAISRTDQLRRQAYRHVGRFDAGALRQLDARPDAMIGDQFNYRLTNKGIINKNSSEAMERPAFLALLNSVQANLNKMGTEIFAGTVAVDPYRKGKTTACDQCGYQAICRIDPWTHHFRVLKQTA